MNTYLIPVTESYGYNYDYIAFIHAKNSKEAYNRVQELSDIKYYDRIVSDDINSYEVYHGELETEKTFFHISQKYAIIEKAFKQSEEYRYMAFFNVNWNNYTEQLASIAATELWSNKTYPNKGILANYIVKTYNKLQSERNIVFGQDYALFNTGLFTKYYELIYAYQSGSEISFLTGYELSSMGVTERPERANYFENPELLLFNWNYPIDVQYKHILDDDRNKNRLPEEFLNSANMVTILNGAIDTMKKRVSSNYKLAIPQYYDGKIQLLLPLCLLSDNKPDIAIAVTKTETCYQGHTCLTLDMAYNNARLIAKPESNWLNP